MLVILPRGNQFEHLAGRFAGFLVVVSQCFVSFLVFPFPIVVHVTVLHAVVHCATLNVCTDKPISLFHNESAFYSRYLGRTEDMLQKQQTSNESL